MNVISRLMRVYDGFVLGARVRGRRARAIQRRAPDRLPEWPPVGRRAGAGEVTVLLPLDQYVPQGRPAMVRPYLVAHERASAKHQGEGLAAPVGMMVR